MARGRIIPLVFGSRRRPTLPAFAIAIILTTAVTVAFVGLHLVGMVFDVNFGIFASVPPQFAGWRPGWFTRLLFVVLGAGWVLTILSGMRYASRGGGMIGTTCLLSVVPLGMALYHRLLFEYHGFFWPANLENMRPTWIYFRRWVYSPRVYVILGGLILGVFLYARWIGERETRFQRSLLVVSSLGVGTFLAHLTRPALNHGRHFYPNSNYLLRDPGWYWFGRMFWDYPGIAGRALWYASIAAALGWLVLNAVRWSRARRNQAPGPTT